MVHYTETCDPQEVYLITNVQTTVATVHEAQCTAPIHEALMKRGLPPRDHLVNAAYIDAELRVSSSQDQALRLVGRRGLTRVGKRKRQGLSRVSTSLLTGSDDRHVVLKGSILGPGQSPPP